MQPPYLVKGDKIGIVAPARGISFEEIHPSIRLFQKWGLEVVLGTHIFNRCDQFAGTDDQRLLDLQQMLDDPTIRAVIFHWPEHYQEEYKFLRPLTLTGR